MESDLSRALRRKFRFHQPDGAVCIGSARHELVSLGSGVAVLGFLAWGTVRRASILVDTFTGWLPRRATALIDAFWMLVWAAVAALLAERLLQGARETLSSGTTTMVLGLPTWWAVGAGALAFAATALAALAWLPRLLRGEEG